MTPRIRLAAERWGSASRCVILGHGGGQTRHAWDRTAPVLCELGWQVIAFDLRGHGESSWCPDGNYVLDAIADDLIALARSLPTRPVLVGASVSGIAGLLATAKCAPPAFAAIVLVDVTPKLEARGVDRILSFMSAHLDDGFASVEDAAEVIAMYLPHRPRPSDLSGLGKNLRLGLDGRYRWHWDPAFVRGPGWAAAAPYRARLLKAARALTIPTMLIRGRQSELVSDASVREFLELVPHALFRDVDDASHMIAGDRNDRFNACLGEFLRT